MHHITMGEASRNFMQLLKIVQAGEDVVITGEQGRENLAIIRPYQKVTPRDKRVLGVLQGKASFHLHEDFEMTDEEFLSS